MAAFLILGRIIVISILESNVIEIAAFLLFSSNVSLTLDNKLLLNNSFFSNSINTIDAFFLSFKSFLIVLVFNLDLETKTNMSLITFSFSSTNYNTN
jgi:positive regulator of sigma E activity